MNVKEAEVTRLLKQIISVDQTPDYSYFKGKAYLNANGDPPKPGNCWCTPREICKQYLVDIERGTLDHALKCLMQEEPANE